MQTVKDRKLIKELHLYLEDDCPYEAICTDYTSTMRSLYYNDIVKTTIPHFLNFRYSKRLFVHIRNEVHEITLGNCDGTNREIRESCNIEKMLLLGEFKWF